MTKKINYLNNKDMLKEIHKSKSSYCEYIDQKYADFDIILETFEEAALPETIEQGKINRANRLTQIRINEAIKLSPTGKVVKKDIPKVLPEDISKYDIVLRIVTYEHIPLAPGRKKNPKEDKDRCVKLPFQPFKHYVYIDQHSAEATWKALKGEVAMKEVGLSHYHDGEFSLTVGAITDTLAKMYMMLVNRFGQKANWRGYTYLDEMKGQALIQLSDMGLRFNEAKSDNPFAYYTTVVNNAFRRVLAQEKTQQNVRDDLLERAGQMPSYTRQLAYEHALHEERARIAQQILDGKPDEVANSEEEVDNGE